MKSLFGDFVFPLYHFVKRDGLNEAVSNLDQNQWMPIGELHELQRKKLADVLVYAAQNVPYYRELFRKIGLPADRLADSRGLVQIPLLTKAIINENRKALASEDLQKNRLLANSTSGSTGEALYFYTDRHSTVFRKAAEIRGRTWAGWRLGDGLVSLWGSPIDQKIGASLRGTIHGWITKHRLLSSYDLSTRTMTSYVQQIINLRPAVLVSYPGPLERFAEFCLENSVTFPSLRGIITSAETLWPHQRSTIEAAFDVPVLDRYGCREFGIIAQECQCHTGLHVNTDRVYVEVVDDADQPCEPGVSGRLLITDLDNYGWPMIRYDIGDNAAWAEDSMCDCGRSFPRLIKIDGRTLDVVRLPTGDRIGGTFWTLLFRSRGGIKQFQVVQESQEGVRIDFIPDQSFDGSCLSYFEKVIRDRCGPDFVIEFNKVSEIELTKSGKRRLIVSNCN
jgi:phenylacetate-CoA ligase